MTDREAPSIAQMEVITENLLLVPDAKPTIAQVLCKKYKPDLHEPYLLGQPVAGTKNFNQDYCADQNSERTGHRSAESLKPGQGIMEKKMLEYIRGIVELPAVQ